MSVFFHWQKVPTVVACQTIDEGGGGVLFPKEAVGLTDLSVPVCFVVQNRTAVHDQQAQP